MGTRTLTYTATGTEVAGQIVASAALPSFTGTFSYSFTWTGLSSTHIDVWLTHGVTNASSCTASVFTIGGGITQPAVFNFTVGTPAGAWDCTNWDTWELIKDDNWTLNAGAVITVVISAANLPDLPPPGPCAYGASPNPSAQVYTYITDVLVTAVAAALGMGPLGLIALSTLIGAPILFPTCASVPALPPALVDGDFIGSTGLPNPLSLSKWMQHFTYGVWLFYCQCNAAPSGSPAPTNPPVPVLPPRLAPGPQPTNPCSNSDVCTTLNHIINILTTINLSVTNSNYAHPPPAYVTSTLHSGLSGNGEFAVSGILGLFVTITTLPNRAGTIIGHPNRLFDVGYISFGSADGWYPRQPITSSPWLTLPEFMGNITKVGYSTPADVVISAQELVASQIALKSAPGT